MNYSVRTFSSVSIHWVKKTRNFSMIRTELSSVTISSWTQEEPKVIDLRTDTFSIPTEEMVAAMMKADLKNTELYKDPTKLALEKKIADLFEKEDAAFVPSGSMANLVSVLVHCRKRPSEVILGHMSHTAQYEQMGGAQYGGVNSREVKNNPDGTFDITELKNAIRTNNFNTPKTRLIIVENTHTLYGGQIMPLEWLQEVVEVAKSNNIALHMDGSRIWNASVKLKVPVSRITRGFDSVNVSLTKALGCPHGSVLLGSKEFISRAQIVIKGLGGVVQKTTTFAAAAIYALDNLIDRMQDDHDHIQMMANAIREMNNPYVTIPPPEAIHTNILNIYLDTNRITPEDFLAKLRTVSKDGPNVVIRAYALTGNSVRFVTYGNIYKADMPDVVEKIRSVIREVK